MLTSKNLAASVEASGFAASGTEEEWGGLLRLWAQTGRAGSNSSWGRTGDRAGVWGQANAESGAGLGLVGAGGRLLAVGLWLRNGLSYFRLQQLFALKI